MGQKIVQIAEPVSGEVEYLRGIEARGLKYPRDIIIWLPPSYRTNPNKSYPVLYAHDGQNLIDPSTAFAGVPWNADATIRRLIAARKIREIILVGIYNTPDRIPEYSMTRLGTAFADFVAHNLKPMIDHRYRTLSDHQHTAVLGSSMGGLCAFLFAWWHPQIFGQAACMSSSFFQNNYRIIQDVRESREPKRIRLYIDVGSNEKMLRDGYSQMVRALLSQGFQRGRDLQYFCARGADHNEVAWGKRLSRPLMFLFGKGQASERKRRSL
jgi:enterochelin esterase-like enzyme